MDKSIRTIRTLNFCKYKRLATVGSVVLFVLIIVGICNKYSTPAYLRLVDNIISHSLDVMVVADKEIQMDSRCTLFNRTSKQRKSVDLRVIILTYHRVDSLIRLLRSLDRARYGGDTVVVDIWIDRSKEGAVSMETVQKAIEFRFAAGECNIHIHQEHVGIRGQWLDTWNPPRDTPEMAVILEDDLTVSPFFYKYLKLVHTFYGNNPDVAGYSLQGKNIKHAIENPVCCIEVDTKHRVFLYPTLGTSGFAPNRLRWIRFKDWLARVVKSNVSVPLIPNHIFSLWYTEFNKTGKLESLWEKEYLYYTWDSEEYVLFPNFEGHKGFTFNWYEDGLHSTGEKKTEEEEKRNLILTWSPKYEQLPVKPVYVNIAGNIIKR